jgi:hypothetical protein
MLLFDAYLFVDWSARNALGPAMPTADGIWVGELMRHADVADECYFRGRQTAVAYLEERLRRHLRCRHRVLLGFDFAYGYPSGLAGALGLPVDEHAWWAVWTELCYRVCDSPENQSNRFQAAAGLNHILDTDNRGGPFWGVPAKQATESLHAHSPGFPFAAENGVQLERLRLTERCLPGVQETWKLYGAGSVGSQTLLGIPYLHRLRRHPQFVHASAVWPFETGFGPAPTLARSPRIVHAEVWPGIVKDAVAQVVATDTKPIKDQIQVRELCRWASRIDRGGHLGDLFRAPTGLNSQQLSACLREEGWILGAHGSDES